MSAGFIYVMVNPAMPGLAKVGKTTRSTSERASELSSATGVPTPFLVVFEQPVANCHAAESWIHAELESRGHRHSSNREFFTAPVHVIVQVVSQASEVGRDEAAVEFEASADEPPTSMAESLLELAIEQLEGSATALPDRRAAYKTMRNAADLGSAQACGLIGIALRNGAEGLSSNQNEALTYLSKAANMGEEWAWGYIAAMFWDAGRYDIGNQYWARFFEAATRACQGRGGTPPSEEVWEVAAEYVKKAIARKETPEVIRHDDLAILKWSIIPALREELGELEDLDDDKKYAAGGGPELARALAMLEGMRAPGEPTWM